MPEIIIDPELRGLIPPLTSDERAGLEVSIKKEGCRDPLVLWGNTLIDGHNRYDICTANNLPFKTHSLAFESRDDVIDWMYSNQLSRRNLTDEKRTYLLGKQYAARKKRQGGDRKSEEVKSSTQNGNLKTAEVIAEEQKVSKNTVIRAEEYSNAVDTVTKNAATELKGIETLKAKILAGDINTTKKDIIALASAPVETQKEIITLVESGKAKGMQDAKRILAAERTKEIPVIEGKYKVIYADPPWEYGCSMNITYGTADKHYPTMSLEEICNLPIPSISEENAVLFLWATSPQLPEALEVITRWGFKYKASFIWDKIKHVMGHYNSVRHEFLLVATKGTCIPEVMKLFDSVVSEERTEHSKKPEIFRTYIETLYPSGKKVELFAREFHNGWATWGNQI